MSYQITEISLYGIELSFEMAQEIHAEICEKIFIKEREAGFPEVLEEWETDCDTLNEYYEELQHAETIDSVFQDDMDIRHFFDYCCFSSRQAELADIEKIPTSFSESRNQQYYRYRYYVDFFLIDGDARADSLRFKSGNTSVFGVYIASDGYGYRDDISYFEKIDTHRYVSNFNKYCKSYLEKYDIKDNPIIRRIQQMW